MKPVLILQHLSADGPAYLGTWLERHRVAHALRNTEVGDAYPVDLSPYSALAILGGELSANDALPSLHQAERLILQAFDRGLPVIGHCLGGQLMARALGARVIDAPAPEIGWQPLDVLDAPAAASWLGAPGRHLVMQWHYEAFELPPGAELLARSSACAHQAFSIGPHLAMQFHIEIDEEKLGRWSLDPSERYRSARREHGSVQDGPSMRAGCAQYLSAHQELADRIYRRWLDAAAVD